MKPEGRYLTDIESDSNKIKTCFSLAIITFFLAVAVYFFCDGISIWIGR